MLSARTLRPLLGAAVALVGCADGPEPEARRSAIRPVLYAASRSNEPVAPLEAPTGLDADKVRLGRMLFHDARLSRDNSVSCASCHDTASGGDDGRPTAVGIDDQVGPLNTPTVFNSSLSLAQFWDGRAATLEEQAAGPVHNPIEMGSDWDQVVAKLAADADFVRDFRRAYPGGLDGDSIADAIATFERSLVTVGAPFDRFLRGDGDAISETAKRGYELFKEIGCVSCHQGRLLGGNMFQRFGVMAEDREAAADTPTRALGRFNVTGRNEDLYRYKVPTLRNVTLTAPYFHDGRTATLDDAIGAMAEAQLGVGLEPDELADIRAFLATLTAPPHNAEPPCESHAAGVKP